MKARLLILLSLVVCLAGPAAAQPVTLRFETCPTVPNVVCTEDVASFTGGWSTITNDPYCSSQKRIYWSASDSGCVGCNPIMKVAFATEVSDLKFSVNNGWPHGVQRVMAWTDTGSQSQVFIPQFHTYYTADPHWRQMVMPGGNHRELTISGMVFNGCVTINGPCYSNYWNYAIDDFIYTKTPADTRIVFGTIGIPGMGDPLVKILPRTTELSTTYPLGSMFFVRLERKQGDSWNPIPASSQMTNETVTNGNSLDLLALFPSHPVIAYNRDARENEKHFQAIHYGTATIVLTTGDARFPRVTLKVTVNAPARLGLGEYRDANNAVQKNHYEWDALINERAHRTGIPPQWIKSMVEQEAHFNTKAYRYELRTRDYDWIQDPKHQYYHGNDPFRRYRMGDGPELCNPRKVPGVTGTCTFSDLDDISPRSRYNILDPTTKKARPIETNDGVVTIRQIVDADNGRYKWFPPVSSPPNPAPRGRRRAVSPPDGLKVPAQTTIASSYGLLQLLWCDVIGSGFKWRGIGGRLNPTLFFDTNENHKRGAGTLNVGPSYAAFKWDVVNADPVDPSYASQANFHFDLRDMLYAYNGRRSYGEEVEGRLDHYTPFPSTVIASPVCEEQHFSAQTHSAQIAAGDTAILGVAIDADDVEYQWFSGSQDNAIAGATTQSLTVSSPGTYWCRAKTECGFVWSDPIVISTAPSCSAPVIRVQPETEKTILEGMTTSFGVEATGTGLRYQWYQGDPTAPASALGQFHPPQAVPLVHENAPAITVQPKTTTTYFLYVENSCGAAISDVVTVTVDPCTPVKIATQSAPTAIKRGESTVVSMALEGTGPFTIQWYTGTPGAAVAITGATGTDVTVTPNANTTYFATVTNRCGSATSTPVLITVSETCVVPSISAQSAPATITRGESTTLSITPGGSTPRTIQWYAGAVAIGGANGATYDATPNATTTYHAVVTNECGEATSTPVTITVVEACVPASISAQSSPATITRGESTTLSITPAGSTPRTIQWYAGATPINGATAATYAVSPNDTTTYHAVVTNACGEATSTPVTITVTAACVPASIAAQSSSVTIVRGESTTLSITAAGSTPRTIQWYTGSSTPISGATSTTLVASPTVTTSYFARVTNACGTATSNTITITVNEGCIAPTVTAQPQSATIARGQPVTLSVNASGTATLHYQWYDGNGTRAGGDSSSLTVTPAETTSYRVVVTNACGSATSNYATVVVQGCDSVFISRQPQGGTINAGQAFQLSVTATGTEPISYRWFAGSTFVGSGAEISVSPLVTTSYSVQVSNECSSETSSTVTVQVCQPASITQGPVDRAITAGQSATLSVSASGTQPLSYQWFAGGVPAGSGSSISVSPSQTTTYTVRVENSCGVDTAQATVSVCQPVQIVSQMPGGTVTAGTSINLSVDATGTGPMSYQWFANGSLFSTNPSVTVTPTATTTYLVRVENACGSDTTSTVFTVCTPPSVTADPQNASISAGQSVTLSVSASGTNLQYQWFTTGGAYVGSGSAVTVSPTATTSYYARVSGDCGTVDSGIATVTVSCVPRLIEQPHWIGPQLLKVTAAGSNLHYAWSYSYGFTEWAAWGSDSDTVETFPSVLPIYWRVIVSNDCGAVESEWFYVAP